MDGLISRVKGSISMGTEALREAIQSRGMMDNSTTDDDLGDEAGNIFHQSRILRGYEGHGRSEQEILDSLGERFFEDGYDPVEELLSNLPHHVDEEYLEEQMRHKDQILEVLSSSLSKKVMSSYASFIEGMAHVQELETDIQLTTILCKNSRLRLGKAKEDLLQGGLLILSKYKKKELYNEVIQMLMNIRKLLGTEKALNDCLEEGDFPKAIKIVGECRESLGTLGQVESLVQFVNRLKKSDELVQKKVDGTLKTMCRNYDATGYSHILTSYLSLNQPTNTIVDKFHKTFVNIVDTSAKDVLLSYVLRSQVHAEDPESCKSMTYEELCPELDEEHLLSCLLQTFEMLCDIMYSLHGMIEWHKDYESKSPDDNGFYKTLRVELEKSRKTLWDFMQRKISTFLNEVQFTSSKVEQFLPVFIATNEFMEFGGDFSESDSYSLTNALKNKSKSYLDNFHRESLEVLRMVLENELWKRVNKKTGFTVDDFKELKPPVTTNNDKKSHKFSSGINPFKVDAATYAASHSIAVEETVDQVVAEEEDDEDEEDEALKQDFIDEDNMSPGRPKLKKRPTEEELVGKVVTSSLMSAVRFIGKYLRIMEVIQPVAVEAFIGMTQCVELYVYAVFSLFGVTASYQYSPEDLSPTAIQFLNRVRDRFQLGRINKLPQGVTTGASFVYRIVNLSPTVDIASSGNMFGIEERTIGAESLLFLVDVLDSIRNRLPDFIPKAQQSLIAVFYNEPVRVVPEMRRYIYRNLSGILFKMDNYVNMIAAVKWDAREMALEHNDYINQLLREFQLFAARLSVSKRVVVKPVQDLMWEYTIGHAMSRLVEGFSRVKKCNPEGRALMSLDLQTLKSGLSKLTDLRPIPKVEHVDAYIKAFYLGEDDMLQWASEHLEYDVKQVVSLVNVACGAMKKKARGELITTIEDLHKNKEARKQAERDEELQSLQST